jgi:hypothetical protein
MASSIPGAARELAGVVIHAVDTAISGYDVATYDRAIARLTAQPAGGRVLGDVLRSLLEDTHPDGFNSKDITVVVGRCYRAGVSWLPPERVDVAMLLVVLAGALGIHESGVIYEAHDVPRVNTDECPDRDDVVPFEPPTWPEYAWHAPLLVADLLPFAPATLGSYLEATLVEYAREAREELP